MGMKSFRLNTGSEFVTFSVNEENLLFYSGTNDVPSDMNESQKIENALDNPIGTGKLEEIIPLNARVVIIVDDATRPTPCGRILPHVLPRIEQKSKNIMILTAPGTHRPMTKIELEEKIGREVMERYPVKNLDYTKTEEYRYVYTTDLGTPVSLHQDVLDADAVITIGNIVPHVVVGWSGGAKTIQPGVSSRETTDFTHWIACTRSNVMEVCGNIDNVAREEVDKIGSGLITCIINTVLNEQKEIAGIFAGDYLKAHREGVKYAEKVLCPEIPEKADILIANAAPCGLDFWQAYKPFAFAQYGVKTGGTIIFIFEAKEGLCGNSPFHIPAMEKYFPMTLEEIMAEAEAGLIEDKVGATNPINHHKIIENAEVICVSKGLRDIDHDFLQFKRVDSVDAAIEMAMKKHGVNATIGIIPFCGETLVKVKNKKENLKISI